MGQKFSDAARTTLGIAITASSVQLTVAAGGGLFPLANTGPNPLSEAHDWFKLVVQDVTGYEVVAVRTHSDGSNTMGDLLRGQDGTVARPFAAAASVGLRFTATDAQDVHDASVVHALQDTANLSDVGNTVQARANLGLGSAATLNAGPGQGDVPTNSILGSAANLNVGTGAGDVPTNAALGSAAHRNVGTGLEEVPLNGYLGTAATRNTGTDSSQVPTNADLGTAAARFVGLSPDQVPLNSQLGSVVYHDAQATAADATPGSAVLVGGFGLGKPLPLTGDTIAAQIIDGIAHFATGAVPIPSDAPIAGGAVKVLMLGPKEWPTLIAVSAYDARMWITTRVSSGGALLPWREVVAANPGNSPWGGKLIGEPFPLMLGAPVPPTDDPSFRYVQLTAGLTGAGQYNYGALTGESVSGSDPTIIAVATVALDGSPMKTSTVYLLNTMRAFVRPATGFGEPVDSQNASHSHTGYTSSNGSHAHSVGVVASSAGGSSPGVDGAEGGSGSTSSAGAHSHTVYTYAVGGAESAPRHVPYVHYMRIL